MAKWGWVQGEKLQNNNNQTDKSVLPREQVLFGLGPEQVNHWVSKAYVGRVKVTP